MKHSKAIIVGLALLLTVGLAGPSWGQSGYWGDVKFLGDISADDGQRNGLFIGLGDFWLYCYDTPEGFHAPSPKSVVEITNGGRLGVCMDLAFTNGVETTGGRQVRVMGAGSRLEQWEEGIGKGMILDGTLTLSGGGYCDISGYATLEQGSKIYLHVGDGTGISVAESLNLNASAWPVDNAHALNLCADASLAAGAYTPVVSANALTAGVAAFGGTWDGLAKTFTLKAAAEDFADRVITLEANSRYLISADDGKQLGVSTAEASLVTLTASSGDWLDCGGKYPALSRYLAAEDRPSDLLAVWQVDVQGAADEVYYSLDIGPGQEYLTLFTYIPDVGWTEISADILEWGSMTYDQNGILGFVASSSMTQFVVFGVNSDNRNPYATGEPPPSVPEPATLALLTLGVAALLQQRRR